MSYIDFYKTTRFFVSGLVVLAFSMIYLGLSLNSFPTWLAVTGWILFGWTTFLDLMSIDRIVKYLEENIQFDDDEEE